MDPISISPSPSRSAKPAGVAVEAGLAPHEPGYSELTRLAMSVLPALLFALLLVALFVTRGRSTAGFIAAVAVGSFVGGGKLVIFAGATPSAPVGLWSLAALVVYCDAATALFMLANLRHLDGLPFVGRRLAATHEAAHAMLRAHRWLRRSVWMGVASFVAVPFQGTGAVCGVLLGRILGMSHAAVFWTVVLGALLGAVPMAMLGRAGRNYVTWLVSNPVIGVAVVVAVLALTIVLGRWFTTAASGAQTRAIRSDDGSPPTYR